MERLFVYGTLRYKKYQEECWGRTMRGTRTVLPGYERNRIYLGHTRYKYWVIYPEKASRAEGLVIEVTPKELEIGDIYEEKYNRRRVSLSNGERVWTYVVRAKYLK